MTAVDVGASLLVFLLAGPAGRPPRDAPQAQAAGEPFRWSAGVEYQRIDDRGLHVVHEGAEKVIEVDHVVLCAGQEPVRGLHDELGGRGVRAHLIGGAHVAAELDAFRAIDEGTRVALAL